MLTTFTPPEGPRHASDPTCPRDDGQTIVQLTHLNQGNDVARTAWLRAPRLSLLVLSEVRKIARTSVTIRRDRTAAIAESPVTTREQVLRAGCQGLGLETTHPKERDSRSIVLKVKPTASASVDLLAGDTSSQQRAHV